MKYYDDFTSKFGFGDGDAIPRDALAVRTAYVYGFNYLAMALKTSYRMVPLDRPVVITATYWASIWPIRLPTRYVM